MPQKLPVPRKSLATYFASHPVANKTAKGKALIKHNPKTYKQALALLAKKRTAKANDPGVFTQPLGTKQADAYADKLAGASFDPALRASKYLSEKQIPDWFGAYTAQLKDIQQRQAASTATATGQIQNFANSSSAVDQTQRDQMTQEMQQSAAQRGATVDPKIALLAQQASASRRAGTDTQGALVAGQGATQANFLLDKERISGGDKISKLSEQARVRQGLLTQRGAEKSKQLNTIREGERRNLLERAAFGLNQQKAADATALGVAKIKQSASDKAAQRATTRRGQDLTHGDRAAANAIRDYAVHHPKTTKGASGDKFKAKFQSDFKAAYNKVWSANRARPDPSRSRNLAWALNTVGASAGSQAGGRAAVDRWYSKKK